MSKLIKRKDGSYSKRGLWDNIRKNKGSGKKPTKDMLKQESKIKKEENMKSMYKKGGKPSKKSSFMEESKEITFDAPGVKPPMKYMMGGLETGMQANARQNQTEGKATMAGKKTKYQDGGKKGLFEKINDTTNALSASAAAGKANADFDKYAKFKTTSTEALEKLDSKVVAAETNKKAAIKKAQEMKKGGAMSRFKTMAAAGKKKMMGGKKC